MPTKHVSGSRSEVVRCPNCGEDYSVTYKRCPFCDERNSPTEFIEDDEYDYTPGADEDDLLHRGGKRLVSSGRRGGGYSNGGGALRLIFTIISLVIIVAAVWIVFTLVAPLVSRGNTPTVTPPASPATSLAPPATTPPVTGTPSLVPPVVDGDGQVVVPPATTAPTSKPVPTTPVIQPIPSTQTATGFTLNRSDFTLKSSERSYTIKATMVPAGAVGFLTWQSDKPTVATVSDNGTVTWVGGGTVNITATLAGGKTQTCIVRCSGTPSTAVTPPASPSPSPSASTPAAAALNRTDFTLLKAGETFRMKVTGTSSTATWTSSNAGVASISGDGTVTAVSKGSANITATVDGKTLKCIVRCDF